MASHICCKLLVVKIPPIERDAPHGSSMLPPRGPFGPGKQRQTRRASPVVAELKIRHLVTDNPSLVCFLLLSERLWLAMRSRKYPPSRKALRIAEPWLSHAHPEQNRANDATKSS